MKDDDKPDSATEALISMLLNGGLYTPPGPDQEPECELHHWQVMEVEGSWGKSHHFVGIHNGGSTGRVSSPIQSFHPAQRVGITRSGRVYKLVGEREPGRIGQVRNMEYVRGAWLRGNGLGQDDFEDVTDAYLARIRADTVQ